MKEKELDNTAYKDFKASIKHYSTRALDINVREKQKHEEVKRLKGTAETKRDHTEE